MNAILRARNNTNGRHIVAGLLFIYNHAGVAEHGVCRASGFGLAGSAVEWFANSNSRDWHSISQRFRPERALFRNIRRPHFDALAVSSPTGPSPSWSCEWAPGAISAWPSLRPIHRVPDDHFPWRLLHVWLRSGWIRHTLGKCQPERSLGPLYSS